VSTTEAQVQAVRSTVAPALGLLGLELYDVELLGGAGARTLRVTVTKEEGGVDLEAITNATQAISPLIDQTADLSGPFLLEVSSPGIERTLRTPEHYQSARGEQVTIKYHTDAGPCRVRGVLVDAGADRLAIEEDGVRVEVPLADVTQARTVFEWGPQPRPGKPGKTPARAKEHR
jgi:ribosome maturation factor RimP